MVTQALTVEEDRRRRMVALSERMRAPSGPDRYRAKAEWWRIHAEETANPDEALRFAENQERLADDMESRPGHYRRKPADMTDYQWMQR